MTFTESTIEQATIDWLKNLGYNYTFDPEIAVNGAGCILAVSQYALLSTSGGKIHVRMWRIYYE